MISTVPKVITELKILNFQSERIATFGDFLNAGY